MKACTSKKLRRTAPYAVSYLIMWVLVMILAYSTKVTDGSSCLLYTSDAADERSSGELGGRRNINKKKKKRVTETREH